MIYTINKDQDTFEIDDNVFFRNQSPKFQKVFSENQRTYNVALFDNCEVMVLSTDKIVVNDKIEDYE
ncbi:MULTISPECIES: hypothetical protein [unclassified Dysgonomonas]|uniref:hypothetical protein n=1 Tax=unclassified Dysgonomonas TaxID=2630389 RepID=UPI0013EA72E4|nr:MULTISPECIES: hypothetical protein [unclassified Dysgonomonas]